MREGEYFVIQKSFKIPEGEVILRNTGIAVAAINEVKSTCDLMGGDHKEKKITVEGAEVTLEFVGDDIVHIIESSNGGLLGGYEFNLTSKMITAVGKEGSYPLDLALVETASALLDAYRLALLVRQWIRLNPNIANDN